MDRRPSPEELLRQVEAAERRETRGRLKVFLGYAAGVGKSARMFDEGRRRKARGTDVVVGAFQAGSAAETEGLEVIGTGALDLAAVLARRPAVCLVDGLAFDNPPGHRHRHRWQEVEELLEAGIGVVTSINLQYVAERQEQVAAIRGREVAESVPEAFLRQAEEIELVDAPPGLESPALSALREIALVLAAEVVDRQLEEYLRQQGVALTYGTQERILVCVTPRSDAATMIRRGRRQADRFHGELHVVYVGQEGLEAADRERLERNLERAREARARVELLPAGDPIEAILRYAAGAGITQLFIGHSQRRGWRQRLRRSPIERFIMEGDGLDIRIFPNTPA